MFGYSIIRKQHLPQPEYYTLYTSLPDLTVFEQQPVAFDFETHGLDPIQGSLRSVSLANDAGCIAIDLETLSKLDRVYVLRWLARQRLIAHNMVFDGAWLQQATGKVPVVEMCTLVMFKLLATEGWAGQGWGLKTAMVDVLGWPESNEVDLTDWLRENKLPKSAMARAPWHILGPYNALDSAATWQLYKYFVSVCGSYKWAGDLLAFHKDEFGNLMQLLIEQQLEGIELDMEKVEVTDLDLESQAESFRSDFKNHPEVKPPIDYYQQVIVEELEAKLKTIDEFTKTGKPAVRWSKLKEKLEAAKDRRDFKIDSTKDMSWLLFDRLHYVTPILTDLGAPSVGAKSFPHFGELGRMLQGYRKLRDRKKFLVSLKEVQCDGVLHPTIKVHGTVTGRASGGRDD